MIYLHPQQNKRALPVNRTGTVVAGGVRRSAILVTRPALRSPKFPLGLEANPIAPPGSGGQFKFGPRVSC